jgi:uncharacterized membrane protein YkvA (DUF1232 family)
MKLLYDYSNLFTSYMVKSYPKNVGWRSEMIRWAQIKQLARKLKNELFTLAEVIRHPKTPWFAKVLAATVVAYAFSPIDLIPDFIPVLGYLDDIILVPLGIYFSLKLTPPSVLIECREIAARKNNTKKKNWIAGSIVLLIWAAFLTWLFLLFYK